MKKGHFKRVKSGQLKPVLTMGKADDICVATEIIPAQFIEGERCDPGNDERDADPMGCTATLQFVDVFVDGEVVGERFYF